MEFSAYVVLVPFRTIESDDSRRLDLPGANAAKGMLHLLFLLLLVHCRLDPRCRPGCHLRCSVRYRTFLRFSSQNFRRLVLRCINADFFVQILILQRFSRSTRLSHLCTARNSKSSQNFVKLFHIFAESSAKIAIFQHFSLNLAQISMKFSQNFDA